MFKDHLSKKRAYHIIKEGYLLKESYHLKQLRKRWIVLNKQYLDCYKDNISDHAPTEELSLDGFSDVQAHTKNTFRLIPNGLNSDEPSRTFVAASQKDMNEWIRAIKQCIASIELDEASVRNGEEWKTPNIHRIEQTNQAIESDMNPPQTSALSICSLNALRSYSDASHYTDEPSYTELDIQQLSVWFTKQLHKLEHQQRKERRDLMSRIDGLLHQLSDIKRTHSLQGIQKQLQQLSAEKDEEYKARINKLKQQRDALVKEIQQRDKRLDIDDEKTMQCNAHDDDCKSNEDPEVELYRRGLLIFQQQRVSVQQLHDMSVYYKAYATSKAPKIVFGDNDILDGYDKHICYKIKTTYLGDPTLYDFRVLMNKQFDVLQQYLMNGQDVIIPLPTSKDVEVNGHARFYKNMKQIIYHRIGVHKELKLPILFIEFIQNKIDQLTKYCRSTQIVQRYVYDKVNYKPNYHPNYDALAHSKGNKLKAVSPQPKAHHHKRPRSVSPNVKRSKAIAIEALASTEHKQSRSPIVDKLKAIAIEAQATASSKPYYHANYKPLESKPPRSPKVKTLSTKGKPTKRMFTSVWQWRNSHNQWISYGDKTSQKIQDLEINGVYEYNSNSFITKLSKETGIEVDTKTEHKRDVKRIQTQII